MMVVVRPAQVLPTLPTTVPWMAAPPVTQPGTRTSALPVPEGRQRPRGSPELHRELAGMELIAICAVLNTNTPFHKCDPAAAADPTR